MARLRAEVVLAVAATAAALALQAVRHREALRSYDPPRLPAFDAYVYVAMAEHPAVFTVTPWGHRVLAPWIAHLLPGADLGAAFRTLTFGSFALAALLLYVFVRRTGHPPWAAALGAAAFVLSPPVGELIAAPFLVEPLACALLVALLLALEMGLGLPALALVAVLGALAKEVLVLFLPVVYFARRGRDGPVRAAAQAGAAIAAAAAATVLLRVTWTPWVDTPVPDLGVERWRLMAASMAAEPGRWLAVALMGGLTPLAALGALRSGARPFARRYGWVLLAAAAQPLLAHYAVHQMVGEMNRYLLYAVPVLIPLALSALDGVASPSSAAGHSRPSGRKTAVVGAAVAASMAAPLFVVDDYRRLDLQGRRDGLYVLGFCQGTLNTARKLRDGAAVLFKMDERRFAPQGFDAARYDRMRWFLRDGWGPGAHYGTQEVVMEAERATLVLPCFRPAPVELTLAMSASVETPVRASVNGRFVGELAVGAERTRLRFLVPAAALFRGDNLVTVEVRGPVRPRLHAVAYSPLDLTPR
ncbi:MAG TPA: hypothetical protein VMR21_17530 [Vicinamibacteria bacterium]|nr:hypothetical protein [Vicinamibacteria bacterium]